MKFKSETFFLITAFFLFLFSFKAEDKNLEIQNHDTYFIISLKPVRATRSEA